MNLKSKCLISQQGFFKENIGNGIFENQIGYLVNYFFRELMYFVFIFRTEGLLGLTKKLQKLLGSQDRIGINYFLESHVTMNTFQNG